MKKDIRIWSWSTRYFRSGKWVEETSPVEVRVMSVAENYAMVRRPGAVPFVVSLKDLSQKAEA